MARAIPNHVYKHSKTSNYYLVLHIGTDTETEEELVVYKRIDQVAKHMWVRPRTMFEETLDNGKERFEDLTPEL